MGLSSEFSANSSDPQVVLVTGPARSGKSEWAEQLAGDRQILGKSVIYVATSQVDATDLEWQQRVEQHRQRRPENWATIEAIADEPLDLPHVIRQAAAEDCLLVDSLGTWLASGLDWEDDRWQESLQALLDALQTCQCDVILVAEETGWGLVPAYPLGRLFRDRLGTLTRHIAAIAHTTYLITTGHVLNLTAMGMPLPSRSTPKP